MSLNMYILRGGELPKHYRSDASAASPNTQFYVWKSNVLGIASWWLSQPHHAQLSEATIADVPEHILAKLHLWFSVGERCVDAADMLAEMTRNYMRETRTNADVVALRASLRARLAQ